MRLLFVSNLFPDRREPYRGLDNATLLHALRDRAEIRVLALRPTLPWHRRDWQAREEDAVFHPRFVATRYLPKIGHRWNHRLYERSLRPVFGALRQEWPFDAVLASWLYPDACAVARLLQESNTRFVAIAQGSDAHQYLRIPARREIIQTELQRASAIITRSAELARLLADAGLPKERLHPVYNGVDTIRFHPPAAAERASTRAALGLLPDAPVLLFVGNFLPVKNVELLIAAHALLVSQPEFGKAQLVLVGGGPLEGALRAQVAAAGLSSRVVFAGRRDSAGVAEAMRAADLLAVSSHNEGVPNVILEAFCTGIPVVATDVGGIAEVLQPPVHGRLCPPGEKEPFAQALTQVLRGTIDHEAIAAHGRSFNWPRAAELYDKLLKCVT